jgi:hypothetical protein
MTDTEIDRLVRAADPAAHLTPPQPGPLPDRIALVPSPRRSRPWLPVAATAAAVVAVVGVAVTTLSGGGSGTLAGGPDAAPSAAGSQPGGATVPQRDHTASAGAPYERAHRLLGALQDAVPDGFTLPTGAGELPIGPDGSGLAASSFEAVRDEDPTAGPRYVYDAMTVVTAGDAVGTLSVRVWDRVALGDPCLITVKLSAYPGTCRVVRTPTGARVGLSDVIADAAVADARQSQWALYQHPDGTVVVLAQGPGVLNDVTPRLPRPVWTVAELARAATDPAFTR